MVDLLGCSRSKWNKRAICGAFPPEDSLFFPEVLNFSGSLKAQQIKCK